MREQPPEIREIQPDATGASRKYGLPIDDRIVRLLFLATVPGLLFTLLGPLGTYEAPLLQRFLFWVPAMAVGAVAGTLTTMTADRIRFLAERPWVRLFTIITLMTLIMTGVVMLTSHLVFGAGSVSLNPSLVFYVWVITIVMAAIGTLYHERNQRIAAANLAPPTPGTTPQPAPLQLRLPVRLQEHPILALEAEDHYVRVHTIGGSELILLRLSDAAKEMGGAPGARTHRSWWVARSAIKSVNRSEGRLSLLLSNGIEAPVSRSYASELREAGWLDG